MLRRLSSLCHKHEAKFSATLCVLEHQNAFLYIFKIMKSARWGENTKLGIKAFVRDLKNKGSDYLNVT